MQRAPKGLGPGGRKFWRSVLSQYELSPPELLILERCCRLLDRLARIDFIVMNSAPAVKGSRDNLIKNPAYVEARECERTLDILVRSLALPMPGEDEGVWRSPDQRMKAQLRWRKFHDEKDPARGTAG